MRYTLLILLLCCSVFCMVEAQAAPPTADKTRATVDLNGDGKVDTITLKFKDESTDFSLTVNDTTVNGSMEWITEGLEIVDIDTHDKLKEIRIYSDNTDDSAQFTLYEYDGKVLRKICFYKGIPEFTGTGLMYLDQWQYFWNKIEKYQFNPISHSFNLVAQPYYAVLDDDNKIIESTVSVSTTIYLSPNSKTVVANLRKDSKATIMLATPLKGKDETKWCYLVKASSGVVGWMPEAALLKCFTELETFP